MLFLLAGAVLAVVVFHFFVFHQYNFPWTIKLINKIPGPDGVFYFGSTVYFWNLKNQERLMHLDQSVRLVGFRFREIPTVKNRDKNNTADFQEMHLGTSDESKHTKEWGNCYSRNPILDRLNDICNMFKVYGSTYRHWFSGVPVVFISELDDYQTVLGSRLNTRKGFLYKHIVKWLGRGLLTSSGHKWHQRRKIITPTFHFSILQGFVQVFNRNTETMVKRLEQAVGTAEIDLMPYITCCTLDNVCETAMGTKINAQSGEPNSYVAGVFRMGAIAAERMFSPILFPDLNFALTAIGREHDRILNTLHGFTEKVIKECKRINQKMKNVTVPPEDETSGVYRSKLTFLELLLEKQKEHKLSDRHIREEVDTFMFEGHDTTSMGITWALFELGCHPKIQDTCYEEQIQIFGTSKRMPTYKDIMSMEYLKRVIQETLRLHPSVPVISRQFEVDLQLKDYLIPAGAEILMCLYHLHRNPEVYPDPHKFDPERFSPEIMESRHRFAYVPFSAGLRNCVGQKFAMLEMLVILSSILRGFHIDTLDERDSIKPVPEMTLRPFKPIRWKITPRRVKSN